MMEDMGYGRERLKDIVEKETEEGQWQEEDIDLKPHEHERALKGTYRRFVIPEAPKTDIDSYFDQTKPHIKTLVKNQLKEMGSAKIIITLWVKWKKPTELPIELDPKDLEDAQDTESNAGDKEGPAPIVNPNPEEMDEMIESKPVIENTLSEWYGGLTDHVLKPVKNVADKAF